MTFSTKTTFFPGFPEMLQPCYLELTEFCWETNQDLHAVILSYKKLYVIVRHALITKNFGVIYFGEGGQPKINNTDFFATEIFSHRNF